MNCTLCNAETEGAQVCDFCLSRYDEHKQVAVVCGGCTARFGPALATAWHALKDLGGCGEILANAPPGHYPIIAIDSCLVCNAGEHTDGKVQSIGTLGNRRGLAGLPSA